VQKKINTLHINVPELRVRLFNTLVVPVVSYGCQVWGADFMNIPGEGEAKSLSKILSNPFEKMQLSYLRWVSGAAKYVSNWVLLKEFAQTPLQLHWIRLVVRWWNSLSSKKHWLAHLAFKDNVQMMIEGDTKCWSAKVIQCMKSLGLIAATVDMCDLDSVCNLQFSESDVRNKVLLKYESVWVGLHDNPRLSPSVGNARCIYIRWFGFEARKEDNSIYHPHVRAVGIPAKRHKLLMQFRLGCWRIATVLGRHNKIPREERCCELCGSNQVEDEFHVIFECKLYDDIRKTYKTLFGGHADMRRFINDNGQHTVASFLSDVHDRRTSVIDSD
jgi:hypothetical protein